MKKILFATSALVASASIASAAEFTIGGSARIGVTYQEDRTNGTTEIDDFEIEQRLRFNFTGIATTDAGVKLEGRIRIESNEGDNSSIAGAGPGAAGFAISYEGFRLDVGNVSDVIDGGSVVNYFGFGVGLTSFIEQSSASGLPLTGFGSGDQADTTITAQYSAGDFTVAASFSNEGNDDAPGTTDIDRYQVGVGYSFGDYSVGAAFGNEDGGTLDNDFWVVTFSGEAGPVGFSILVSDEDANEDVTYGGSLNYQVSDATSIRFAVSEGGAASNTDTAVGIGFRHSLGDGVTLAGGIGQNTVGDTVADLGVSFSF